MEDTTNLNGAIGGVDKDDPVVPNSKAQFVRSNEGFHIASARFRESIQSG